MALKPNINFKFAQNWKKFLKWYDVYTRGRTFTPAWDIQIHAIEKAFNSSTQGIVNWKQLWEDFDFWHSATLNQKGRQTILWSETKRQIETLMLEQLEDLNKENFVLVFLNKGKPDTDGNKMTYWEALKVKKDLSGDKNGNGGAEDLDKITIVNLKHLIK